MKTIRNIFLLIAILFVQLTQLYGQNLEWDNNVIYNEAQVPFYELPDPMISIDGKQINSVEEWEKVRRPQIMAMFASTLYGRTPAPEQEVEVVHKNVEDTGPTRSSLDNLEKPTGLLMLQGDHGPVAYRNIRIRKR